MISIFDFDLTVTKKHSFRKNRIETGEPEETWYVAGKNAAKAGAVRQGVEDFLRHDAESISAIATFHNNPEYVAGHIAHILGKDLVRGETLYSDGTPAVAIDVYKVKGVKEERPFLISYLPYTNTQFQDNMQALQNKNSQIEFLRATWIQMGLAQESDVISFYDDSEDNFNAAEQLEYISGYLVNTREESFAWEIGFLPKIQRYVPSNGDQYQQQTTSSANISMAVLSGFIAVAGIAAVAIAFAVFNAAALNPVGLTLALVGTVSAVVGLGFFARSMGGNAADDENLLTSSAAGVR